jgi:CubicO group peptidase (beta-lactamase class C family)
MTKGIHATQIQARVSELLAEYGIPSAAIGVLHDGEITDFAIGVKNVSTEELATTDTIYQCGSMTKTWTALAFMQLADEGKVGLDEPVRTYLPGFTVADPEVSARIVELCYLSRGEPGIDPELNSQYTNTISGKLN